MKDPNLPGVSSATTNTWSNGYYIQDSWTIANVLTLNFGVRLDTAEDGVPDLAGGRLHLARAQHQRTMWAPRVQAIWDFTGTGRGKIQGNWGMYYESIPLDMALRAFGAEQQVTGFYQLGTCANKDPKTNPGWSPMATCPNVYGNAAGQGPGPNTVTLARAPAASGSPAPSTRRSHPT